MSAAAPDDVLDERLLKVVHEELGFKQWTPVQQAAIPQFLSHCDVAVEACTGSGKTLAYLLPVFQMLLRARKEMVAAAKSEEGDSSEAAGTTDAVSTKAAKKERAIWRAKPGQWSAIIISPTRELSQQIFRVAQPLAKAVEIKTLLLTGGSSVLDDVESVSETTVDVVISTPGRLDDIMSRARDSLNFRRFEALVLDEADVLLDMGFERTVTSILSRLPKQRRTGLFSATQTKEVRALIRAGLRNPALISVKVQQTAEQQVRARGQQTTPTSLANFYLVCEQDEKLARLCAFLRAHENGKTLVFLSTCASVAFFERALALALGEGCSLEVRGLHGKMVQKKRSLTYDTFVTKATGVLLCTDVAARGIDIPDVDWIVQFDPPQDPSFFVHRVGRTARAGRAGNALLFLLPKETAYINLLEQRKVPIQPFKDAEALAADKRTADALGRVRAAQFQDRDLLERGTRAFVAFMRSYKEHKCQFIFRLVDLDMARAARSFALLRVPNMAELRESKGISGFEEETSERVAQIPYKDKRREAQRLARFKETVEELRRERYAKVQEKKRKEQDRATREQQPKRRKQSRQRAIQDEWDTLAREETLFKRFRKGKLSKAEYEAALAELDSEAAAPDPVA